MKLPFSPPRGCTILHFHQPCAHSSTFCEHVIWTFFKKIIVTILIAVQWDPTVVYICNSQTTNDRKAFHELICTYVSFMVKLCSSLFPLLFISFLCSECKTISDMLFADIFSHSVACLLIFLIMSLYRVEGLHFHEFQIIFFFYELSLWCLI